MLRSNIVEISYYAQTFTPGDLDKLKAQVLDADTPTQFIIDLGAIHLGDEGVIQLKEIIASPKVVELRLDDNLMTGVGVDFICQTLAKRTQPLLGLSLSGNQIGYRGVASLTSLLGRNYPLEALSLASCGLTAAEIALLAQNLHQHPTLKRLNIGQNKIRNIYDIALMLKMNKTLTSLNVEYSELNDEAASLLGEGLRENAALTTLQVAGNDLKIDELIPFLIDNNTLLEYIGPDTADNLIQRICKRNAFIPCNSRWLPSYAPETDFEDKCTQLICQTTPMSPSLLYIAGSKLLQSSKSVQPEIKSHIYKEATNAFRSTR